MARSKLTNCKVCGAEVAKSAKTCPCCGARVKKRRFLLVVLLILLAIVVVGSLGDQEKPESENAVSSVPLNKTYGVGEAALIEKVAVSMVNVTESRGSEFNQPTDGNVFVLCEFEIANNSGKEITVSSLISFEAYCDDYSCNSSLTAMLEKGNKNQLDGTVAAGKKLNGVIGYEVPADWKELEIRFSPSFWSGKNAVFVANSAMKQQAAAVPQQKPAEVMQEQKPAGTDQALAVGELGQVNGISATLTSVNVSNGSEYNRPNAGNVFVLCEFEIANGSNEELAVSSMMSFEAYCDDYACTVSLTALIEKGSKNQLDGTVAAGKKMNGVIGYEVPANWKKLEIRFTPDIWTGKSITFLAANG